jgi:hypothetical protein
MKLSALAVQYVAYKQSMGMRFHTEARTLRSFCRAMGDIAVAEIAASRGGILRGSAGWDGAPYWRIASIRSLS